MPTRSITVMGILQVMALVGGSLFVKAYLRAWEKGLPPHSLERFLNSDWYGRMSFARNFVLGLLLIPVVLTVICAWLTRTHRDIAYLGPDGFWLAVVVTVSVFIYVAITIESVLHPPYWLFDFIY